MINYNVDYKGILRIYKDNIILVEFTDCENKTDEEIKQLINDYLKETDFYE